MDITIISQRYAKALFDLALEMNRLEQVNKDMTLVKTVTEENPEFERLLESPIIPAGKKNKIISAIFKNKVDELTARFLHLVTRKEREIHLESIGLAFVKLYKEHHNIITIRLTSPEKLDDKSKKDLLVLLKESTHKNIELIEETDGSLIGGFVLTLDDRKYDASIRHQLEKLGKVFEKNLYIKGF